MKKHAAAFAFVFCDFIIAALTTCGTIAVVYGDVHLFPQTCFTEYGLVEAMQELLLLIAASILCVVAIERGKNAMFLVSGLLFCMLIREFDLFFERWIAHGSWVYVDLVIAAAFIFLGTRGGIAKTLEDINEIFKQRGFMWLFWGLVVVLIFSRLFGMGEFWQSVLRKGLQYEVKRVAEETLELWGYMLIAVSSFFYLLLPSSRKED